MRIADPFIVISVSKPTAPFLKNSLKPLMISRLESAGDICHDALIVVELVAITVNAVGACKGTEMLKS